MKTRSQAEEEEEKAGKSDDEMAGQDFEDMTVDGKVNVKQGGEGVGGLSDFLTTQLLTKFEATKETREEFDLTAFCNNEEPTLEHLT